MILARMGPAPCPTLCHIQANLQSGMKSCKPQEPHAPTSNMANVDTRGRPLRDLRISVTDRCNFRCKYCMPKETYEEHKFLPRSGILTFEEITQIVDSLSPIGLKKVRLTGGEPLLRRNITELITMLRNGHSELDIALTTNGVLLAKMANALADSGLNRVTISLDSLNENQYKELADVENSATPESVIQAIEIAQAAGLTCKVNTVVQAGVNEDQVVPLIERLGPLGVPIRFIEFMDVGMTNDWNLDKVVTGAKLREMISQKLGPLEKVAPGHKSDVARRWKTPQGWEIGFIESISSPFCGDCSRARLSADGHIFTCLFSNKGHDIKSIIRMEATNDEIAQAIQSIWQARDDAYSEQRGKNTGQASGNDKIEMSFIGG